MQILHLTSHLNVGGITRYLLSLAKRQVANGHHVVVASETGSAVGQVEAMGARHWRYPLRTSAEFSPQVWWTMHHLTARLRQTPVDVIHAHTRVAQVIAEHVSRRTHIPYVTTWHGIFRPRLGRRLWPCTGRLTIAISELVRDHLRTTFHVPEARLRCISNGVDPAYYAIPPDDAAIQAYRQRWDLSVQYPIIGGVGRLAAGRVKGFDTLLVVGSLLRETLPGLQVLIVGDGPRRPFLEDIAQRLGVRDCVRFAGETQDIRVPLAVMDLFVFTSRWPEAFGLTLVEAMAAGKPVIATQAGAVPEVIEHNVHGWLVPADNPAAIAQAVTTLLNDRATAQRLAHQAQRRVQDAFSLDRMAAQIEAVYREVL